MEDDIPSLSRPQMFLFGCTLTADKREVKVDIEDDDTEHQLSLKAACLGAEAEDMFHMVEMKGLTYDGKITKVPLVALKPSVLPSMTLGGFEITPPVTFRLQSGSGPVHISGQHFVGTKDEEDEEEEHNTSPMKRPAGQMSGRKPEAKKLKMDSDDEEDEDSDEEDDDDDDDEDEESDEDDVKVQNTSAKEGKKTPDSLQKTPQRPGKQNGSQGKPGGSAEKPKTPTPGKNKAGPSPSKPLSLEEMKSKLASMAKKGNSLPKSEQKFENFARSAFKSTDKSVIKSLWGFLQTLTGDKK